MSDINPFPNQAEITRQQELENQIKEYLSLNLDLKSIRDSLTTAGYTPEEVNQTLSKCAGKNQSPATPPLDSLPSQETTIKTEANPPEPLGTRDTPLIVENPPPNQSETISETNLLPLISLGYYKKILDGARHMSNFLLLAILALIISVRPAYLFIKKFHPIVNNFSSKAKSIIETVYPEKLEVNINNGILATNVPEPYYIDVPNETLNTILPDADYNRGSISKIRLLAIDTKGKAENFERYQTYALLTANSLVYYNDNKINIQSLRNIQKLTINKNYILLKFNEFNKNNRIEKTLKVALFLVPFLIFIGNLFAKTIALLISALINLVFTKINSLSLNFADIFSLTINVAFVPTIIFSLANFIESLGLVFENTTILGMIILAVSYVIISNYKNLKDDAINN